MFPPSPNFNVEIISLTVADACGIQRTRQSILREFSIYQLATQCHTEQNNIENGGGGLSQILILCTIVYLIESQKILIVVLVFP